MAEIKPRFRIVDAVPVEVPVQESKVDAARRRFGRPFCHETGAKWKPREVPLLTEWMATRSRVKP